MDEHTGIEKGVEPWKHPEAYLSKNLDFVTAGWPPCLRIIVTIALLVKDVDKLTLGQNPTIDSPHTLEGILKSLPDGD